MKQALELSPLQKVQAIQALKREIDHHRARRAHHSRQNMSKSQQLWKLLEEL